MFITTITTLKVEINGYEFLVKNFDEDELRAIYCMIRCERHDCFGDNKIRAIKFIRKLLPLGPKDAKRFVESAWGLL